MHAAIIPEYSVARTSTGSARVLCDPLLNHALRTSRVLDIRVFPTPAGNIPNCYSSSIILYSSYTINEISEVGRYPKEIIWQTEGVIKKDVLASGWMSGGRINNARLPAEGLSART